jgi:hypothetical protein
VTYAVETPRIQMSAGLFGAMMLPLGALALHGEPTQTVEVGGLVSSTKVCWITLERPSLRSDTRIR